MFSQSLFVRRAAMFALLILTAFGAHLAALAQAPLWSAKGAKWYDLMDTGNLLVGTETGLMMLDGETGREIWRRADLKGIKEDEYTELEGTPFLVIADNSGWAQRKTKLFTLDLLSAETVWTTDKIYGYTAQVSPVYEKDMLIFLTIKDNRVNKDKPDIAAIKLSTGEVLWQTEYTEKVDLYGVEKTKKSGFGGTTWVGGVGFSGDNPRYDLSGENPPVFDNDSMYLTYAGLHRFDLKTGQLVWKVPYDVTEGALKRTNGEAIVDGETIYTSAKGVVRAVNKADGSIRWQTKDLSSGGVAEMIRGGDVIYGRFGGIFYSHKNKEYVKKSPIGVVAIDKATGALKWQYSGAKNSITNMILLPEQNSLLIADEKNLIALDTNSSGKVKEAYKVKLEFKNSLGATGVAAKAVGAYFGGVGGFMKAGGDTTDEPVALVRQENGTVVARGKQHLLAFNPQNRQIAWATKYDAPGIAAWQKIAITAITAYVSSLVAADKQRANADYRNNRGSLSESNAADARFDAFWSAYGSAISKRFSASKQQGNFVYVLTKVKSGTESGTGLVGVDMLTGSGARQILINDKKPDYEVDEATGRLFNLDGGTISAFGITERLATENEDGKKDKKGKKED